MAQNETGHEKNLANFKTLNTFIIGMGTGYQPANPIAALTNVQDIITKADPIMTSLHEQVFPVYSKVVDDEEQAFAKLPKLATRILKAFKAVADTDEEVATAASLVSKIRPSGSSKKKDKTPAADAPDSTHSTSQRSYDNQIAFFSELIGVLTTNGKYKPKEADLQIPTLTAFRDELQAKTDAVDPAEQAYDKARNNRDDLFYNEQTGMLHVAQKVKDYLSSVYSYGSKEMKYINALKFIYPKK